MPIEDRAKQFMPFAALKGLPEALAAREKIIVPRAELSEEVLNAPEDEKVIARVREKVNETMKDYPLFAY